MKLTGLFVSLNLIFIIFCFLSHNNKNVQALTCFKCDETIKNGTQMMGNCDQPSQIECGRGDTHCVSMHETGRPTQHNCTQFMVFLSYNNNHKIFDTFWLWIIFLVPQIVYKKKDCAKKNYCHQRNNNRGSRFAVACSTCNKNFCNSATKEVQMSSGTWISSQPILIRNSNNFN